MRTTTEVFGDVRAEHAALLPHVEALRVAAEAMSLPSGRDAFEFVDEAWRFLSGHLLEHAAAEERTLYVAFTEATESSAATQLLSMDHAAITRLVTELATLRRAAADHDVLPEELVRGLRRVLYGLYALIQTHFDKEEAVVLPTLAATLDSRRAAQLVHEMQHPVSHH